ncbi:hypothetical protein [Amycolatopsis sp. NPDC054798]
MNVMAPAVPAGTTIVFGNRDGQIYHRGDVVLASMPAQPDDEAYDLIGRVIRRTLPPTTAFTAAGLPGAPEEDQGPFLGRVLAGAGAGAFLIGFLGAVVTGVRRGRKRRLSAAYGAVSVTGNPF